MIEPFYGTADGVLVCIAVEDVYSKFPVIEILLDGHARYRFKISEWGDGRDNVHVILVFEQILDRSAAKLAAHELHLYAVPVFRHHEDRFPITVLRHLADGKRDILNGGHRFNSQYALVDELPDRIRIAGERVDDRSPLCRHQPLPRLFSPAVCGLLLKDEIHRNGSVFLIRDIPSFVQRHTDHRGLGDGDVEPVLGGNGAVFSIIPRVMIRLRLGSDRRVTYNVARNECRRGASGRYHVADHGSVFINEAGNNVEFLTRVIRAPVIVRIERNRFDRRPGSPGICPSLDQQGKAVRPVLIVAVDDPVMLDMELRFRVRLEDDIDREIIVFIDRIGLLRLTGNENAAELLGGNDGIFEILPIGQEKICSAVRTGGPVVIRPFLLAQIEGIERRYYGAADRLRHGVVIPYGHGHPVQVMRAEAVLPAAAECI